MFRRAMVVAAAAALLSAQAYAAEYAYFSAPPFQYEMYWVCPRGSITPVGHSRTKDWTEDTDGDGFPDTTTTEHRNSFTNTSIETLTTIRRLYGRRLTYGYRIRNNSMNPGDYYTLIDDNGDGLLDTCYQGWERVKRPSFFGDLER
jgi:hypothetical protein